MTTTRARQLEKLGMSLPAENQKFAQAQNQARQTQLKEQIRQTQPGTGTAQMAQQLGAQQQQTIGQQQLATAQKGQQSAQLIGQMGLQEQARGQRQEAFQQQLALTKKQEQIGNQLARIDRNLKNELLDRQLEFQKDQAGQALWNDRQLADWAAVNARNQEEYQNYVQTINQMNARELQMLEAANRKLTQVLNQNQISEGKQLDRELRKELAQKKQAIELEIQRKQNKARNKAAMAGAIGTVVGAGIGATFGGPAGAAVGGQAGGAVGTIVSSQT